MAGNRFHTISEVEKEKAISKSREQKPGRFSFRRLFFRDVTLLQMKNHKNNPTVKAGFGIECFYQVILA